MLAYAPYVALLAVLIISAGKEHLRDQSELSRFQEIIDSHDQERYAWVRERAELTSRVQAPHLIPAPLPVNKPLDPAAPDAPTKDEWDLVGQILAERPETADAA